MSEQPGAKRSKEEQSGAKRREESTYTSHSLSGPLRAHAFEKNSGLALAQVSALLISQNDPIAKSDRERMFYRVANIYETPHLDP